MQFVPQYGPDKIRNVAILGHSHEGKTTLAEALLFATGAIGRMGSTEAGTAALDFEPEEQKRGISINMAVAHVEQDGFKVNLLDTPGFFDFGGQVVAASSDQRTLSKPAMSTRVLTPSRPGSRR